MEEGASAYLKRFGGERFSGHILPFGCLVDYFPTPTPTRPQKTRKVVDNDVMLGDGEEYAAPGEDEFQCDVMPDYGELFGDHEDDAPPGEPSVDHPSRNDGDGYDDDEQEEVPDITFSEKRGSFLPPVSQGSFWDTIMNGEFLVADLEVFKQNAKRPPGKAGVLCSERKIHLSNSNSLR